MTWKSSTKSVHSNFTLVDRRLRSAIHIWCKNQTSQTIQIVIIKTLTMNKNFMVRYRYDYHFQRYDFPLQNNTSHSV